MGGARTQDPVVSAMHSAIHRAGRWEWYVGRKRELKERGYRGRGEARAQAFREFLEWSQAGGVESVGVELPAVVDPLGVGVAPGGLSGSESGSSAPAPLTGDEERGVGSYEYDPADVKRLMGLIDLSRQCTEFESIRWAHSMMLVPMGSIVAGDVPSAGSMALLVWARNNPKEFFSGPYGKLVAAMRRQMEQEEKRVADGSELRRTVRALQRARSQVVGVDGQAEAVGASSSGAVAG